MKNLSAMAFAFLILGTVAAFLASLASGYAPIPAASIWRDLLTAPDSVTAVIVTELRLPRGLLAMLVGGSLGMAGAAMQGLLRNPLAEPGIVGVSSAAALGAVVVFYSGLGGMAAMALPLGGMAGALLATLTIFLLAGRDAGTLTLILAGVAINSLAGALTALALNLSPNPYAALEVMFWLMGSLADRSLDHVALIVLPTLIGWALLMGTGRWLNALALGEDVAASLGCNLAYLRLRIIIGTAFCVGSAVAVTGAVGFVGLVVPHLLRRFFGHRPGQLLLPSAFGGAILVLAADMVARQGFGGPELKLGVITALLGAPFFLWLVLHLRGRAA